RVASGRIDDCREPLALHSSLAPWARPPLPVDLPPKAHGPALQQRNEIGPWPDPGFSASQLLRRLFLRVSVLGLAQHVTAARLLRPVLPGAPGFRRVRTVTAIAGIDLALPQIGDLAAQLLGAQQRARIARKIDRHPHHLDDRAGG